LPSGRLIWTPYFRKPNASAKNFSAPATSW
jgi:hypothetical protein